MYCARCGTQLPDDAVFCVKCGTQTGQSSQSMSTLTRVEYTNAGQVVGSANATSLKCPTCGAAIAPKFGEMIITCEYCGSSITLGSGGWSNIQKQTMLPLRYNSTSVSSRPAVKVSLIAVFTAISLGTNFAMIDIPNVKLMDSFVFIAAFLFGLEVGLGSAVSIWGVYGFASPYGGDCF